MGTRTYYVISHVFDYDGYSFYVDYLGTNFQAVVERYRWLFQDLKERYFLNEGVDEGDVTTDYVDPIDRESLDRGTVISSSMNDDNAWVTLSIRGMKSNAFNHEDVTGVEERYRMNNPNAKY